MMVPDRCRIQFGWIGVGASSLLEHELFRSLLQITSSDNYDGSSVDGILFHRDQSFVGLVEWKGSHLGLQTNLARNLEKISSVGPSHVCDTPKLALAPQQAVVVELWNPVQVNGVDGNHSSLAQAGECRYYDIATGSKS